MLSPLLYNVYNSESTTYNTKPSFSTETLGVASLNVDCCTEVLNMDFLNVLYIHMRIYQCLTPRKMLYYRVY